MMYSMYGAPLVPGYPSHITCRAAQPPLIDKREKKFTQTKYLNGGWVKGKNFVAGALGVAIQVEKHVDAVSKDTVRHGPGIGKSGKVDKMVGCLSDLGMIHAPVTRCKRIAENFHAAAVVIPGNLEVARVKQKKWKRGLGNRST